MDLPKNRFVAAIRPTENDGKPLVDSKEVGLAIGLILGQELFGMKDLHYGLWEPGEATSIWNLSQAQQRYSQFIVSQIPVGAKKILDVGAGAGRLATLLLENNFEVDCVSPSPFLTKCLPDVVQTSCQIYPCKFEELVTEKKYDVVLFSESFQYVNPAQSVAKAASLLKGGGHVIISDFFKRHVPGDSPLGGGHEIDPFLKLLAESPFTTRQDLDLTTQTAPTMDVFGGLLDAAATPTKDLVVDFIKHRHPYLSKFLGWKLQKKFEKINRKYFTGQLSAKSFADFKTYRCFLLQLKS